MRDGTLSFDTVLELCQSRTRRFLLAVLAERRGPVSIEQVVETICDRSSDDEDTNRTLRLSLHHTHIPKLEAASVVKYDPDRSVVAPTDSFEQLEPHLSSLLAADPAMSPTLEA